MLRGMLALWMCVVALPACGAVQWSIGDGQARPGEIGYVEVRLRHDGDAAGSALVVTVNNSYASIPDTGGPLESATGIVCARRNEAVVDLTVVQWPAPGVEVVACRIPLRPRLYATRIDLPVRGHLPCTPAGDCAIVAIGHFLVDGPVHWRDRALIVVPRAEAPPLAQLLAFDYANSTAPAPLSMFDAPRPAHVAGAFAAYPEADAYGKVTVLPNPAVAALLRSVRAIYADESGRTQAQASAARDPAVEGVSLSAYFGLRTWPPVPKAGEPFALWLTAPVCTSINPEHFDDRTVEITGDSVTVTVPARQYVDFATCPGGESHALFNLPGLPAGQYQLALVARNESGDTAERHEIALSVQTQGSAGANAIHAVPGLSAAASAALALLLATLAVLQSRRITS